MAITDLFSRRPKRFVEESTFRSNLATQLQMTPMVLEQLRGLGVTPARRLKLEFFFYTNTQDKAESLAKALKDLHYQVELGTSASNKKQLMVTGWTLPMAMNSEVVLAWTRQMCEAGYSEDCSFDGWATTPEQ
jgi:Regulator of ribonuclease activity B